MILAQHPLMNTALVLVNLNKVPFLMKILFPPAIFKNKKDYIRKGSIKILKGTVNKS